MVDPIEGYGRLQPLEEGRRGWHSRIDLVAHELLTMLGVIGCQPSEDHEATIWHQKAAVLPLGIVHSQVRVLPVLPFIGASRQEPLHCVSTLGVTWV